MKERELKEKYLQIQLLDQQINQLQQQITAINQQIIESKTVEDSLDNLSKTKINTNLFSPLGLGIFVETQLKDNKTILMNVGSKVIVKKSILKAKDLLQKRINDLKKTLKHLEEQLIKNVQLITILDKEIEASTSKLKKK